LAIEVENPEKDAFYEMSHMQRCCQVCGATGAYESHHVVERSELRRVGRLDLLWDRRNCMRLCPECHRRHTNRAKPIVLLRLLDMHFEFAFQALGNRAARYLGSMYAGPDERLDRYQRRWEEQHGRRPAA
jgi:hypothetical protein